MTKVIILGQEPKEEIKVVKPIEFVKVINEDNLAIYEAETSPKDWENIELIGSGKDFDIMYAYDQDRNKGMIYLGHFNDGVVE